MKNSKEKLVCWYDGTGYRARLRGGSGVVFGDTENIVLARANSWRFDHVKSSQNNRTKDHTYDASI
jgi:hypothetical protein